MRVVERFIMSKTGNMETCEDYIFVNDDFAAVLDGVTSKTKLMYNNKSKGRVAVELISQAIEKFPKDISAEAAVEAMTKAVEDFYKEKCVYDEVKENTYDRVTASIIIYSKFHEETWMVGDCQCLIDDKLHTNGLYLDEVTSNARALFAEIELLRGKTVEELLEYDTSREFIAPLLLNQSMYQNKDLESEFCFGVIDGFTVPERHIKKIKLQPGAKHIVLSSDGYPVLKPTLEETEVELQKVIREDPLCIYINKSTKGIIKGNVSFDDRSYLKLEL